MHSPPWYEAMLNDHTWDLLDLPAGHHTIGLKSVFKVKKDFADAVIKHNFEEVFAPVARLESVHLLLALAVHEG